ncbi:hypothetical protein [Rhodanobacter sp. DHB23]|nr:hypothetical protein [Rhodanobacter sp. DHB23]
MNTIAPIRAAIDRLAPLLLALFSSALIMSILVWSLHGFMHPLA